MTTATCLHPTTLENKPAGILSRIVGWAGRSHPVRGGLLALSIALSAAGSGAAAPVETDSAGTRVVTLNKYGDDELLIDEVFQSHLPTTLANDALRLSVHPHLGDWREKDHMRITTSLRYGLTNNCEISASSNLYFSHGHGDIRAFKDYGAANLKFGAKLNLGQPLFAGWETAAGIDYEYPVDHPPAELTDGLRHLRPYVTFSHRLESHPDLRIFVGFRLDDVAQTSLPGEFGKNAFRESSTGITGGIVIDRQNWHYTFEASFDTTRLIGHTKEDISSFRPGVIWEIPTRRDPRIRSNWTVGVALSDTYGPGGNSMGASFKLRYSRNIKNPIHLFPLPFAARP